MAGVFVAFAVWRQLTTGCAMSLIQLVADYAKTGELLMIAPSIGDALIERSRSGLMTALIEKPFLADYDVLVSIDDDISFTPEDFRKVVAACRERQALVAGAYPTRERDSHLALRELPGHPLSFMPGPSRLAEVDLLTTGLMAVPRSAIEAIARPGQTFRDADGTHQLHRTTRGIRERVEFIPFYWPFQIKHEDGAYELLSEDWALCHRAKQLGYQCLVDTSVILKHEGMMPVTVWDIPEIGVMPPKWGDPVIDLLPEQIAGWMGVNAALVPSMLHRGTIRALDDHWLEWREQHPDDAELDWYMLPEVGDLYTLELARWHTWGGGTPRMLAAACEGNRVLSYGGGIGTFALRAAIAGADSVLEYEVNQRMCDFAMHRAEQLWLAAGIGIDFAATSDIRVVQDSGPYDLIESWHMLEHVDNPCDVLELYRALLRPNGELFFDCDFHRNGEDNHMHHELEEFGHTSVEEMMAAHGFRQTEPYVYVLAPVAEVAHA